ncbi:MAG: O-antigen ligase family protein [Bacteroidetes bacterium]|nr:O-antigen ligase family protein [Bacteroidota bacterium]
MIKLSKITVFYALILTYILGNSYVLLFKRDMFYAFNLLPIAILIFYWAIFNIERVVYLMVFCTPLAVTLKNLGLSEGIDLSLPTEPLMAGLMVIYLLNELMYKITPRNILKHPITILIFIQLLWMFITTLSSVDFTVSLKYLIARLWFVFSCYFVGTQLLKNKNNIRSFILAYAIPLAIVCLITIYQHAAFNFDDKIADWIVSPFYNDHTAYGAALAMYIPVIIAMLFQKNTSNLMRMLYAALVSIFVLAIILSFARAGWLSLVAATGVFITLMLRIKFRTLLITTITLTVLFFSFQEEIFIALGRNNTDSEGDLSKNISSMTNISTDASNLERINRWSCAMRMFYEKPYFGWGPGTYMFNYAPYQKSSERTIISTNFGTNGNAHSEYLGPLTEQGVLGLLIVVSMLFSTMFMGYRLVYTVKDKNIKAITIGVFLGIFTYFVHGFLNNFLDTDKLSVPFWGFMAILVCIDVYHRNGEHTESNTETNRI